MLIAAVSLAYEDVTLQLGFYCSDFRTRGNSRYSARNDIDNQTLASSQASFESFLALICALNVNPGSQHYFYDR